MDKKIYIEPPWKMHSYYRGLMANHPQGYTFVALESPQSKVMQTASKFNITYSLFIILNKIVPVNIAKSYLDKFRHLPDDIALTYAFDHIVCRKEPWVVDVEFVNLLVGYYNSRYFKRSKGILEKALASASCKKIICGTETAKQSILLNLDCKDFSHKFGIVPFATQKKNFTKKFGVEKIKLLFVGSGNILGSFNMKGGRETLEAFTLLTKQYNNLELVVRSDVPQGILKEYGVYSNIRIINKNIPWSDLEREFLTADIFVLPVHCTPFSVFLDAMSYELPIVTIDAWANPEVVEDGKTGLLVRKSESVLYYVKDTLPGFATPQFFRSIRKSDPRVVNELAEKISILIENPELRRGLGKAGRWEVELGKFSIENRNNKLKRILDEATDDTSLY